MKKYIAVITAALILLSSCAGKADDTNEDKSEVISEVIESDSSDIPAKDTEKLLLYRGDYYLCGEPYVLNDAENADYMFVGTVNSVPADKSPENPLESNFLPGGAKIFVAPCGLYEKYKAVLAVYKENGETFGVELTEKNPYDLPSETADAGNLNGINCYYRLKYKDIFYQYNPITYYCKNYEDIGSELDKILENAEYIGKTEYKLPLNDLLIRNELESNCFSVGTKLYKSGEDIIAVYNELEVVGGEYRIACRLGPEREYEYEDVKTVPATGELPSLLIVGKEEYISFDILYCMLEDELADCINDILERCEYIGEIEHNEYRPESDMSANYVRVGTKLYRDGENIIALCYEPYKFRPLRLVYAHLFEPNVNALTERAMSETK